MSGTPNPKRAHWMRDLDELRDKAHTPTPRYYGVIYLGDESEVAIPGEWVETTNPCTDPSHRRLPVELKNIMSTNPLSVFIPVIDQISEGDGDELSDYTTVEYIEKDGELIQDRTSPLPVEVVEAIHYAQLLDHKVTRYQWQKSAGAEAYAAMTFVQPEPEMLAAIERLEFAIEQWCGAPCDLPKLGSDQCPYECAALLGRHLIKAGTWSQRDYDLLTFSHRITRGPVHPGDPIFSIGSEALETENDWWAAYAKHVLAF